MADHDFHTMLPPRHGRLDLMAGLRAWLAEGGRFDSGFATKLGHFSRWSRTEPAWVGHDHFDPADLDSLAPIAAESDLYLNLRAPWFAFPIALSSHHHAAEPVMCLSHNPGLWGFGEGGVERADAAVAALARAAGAAYVVAAAAYGPEEVLRSLARQETGDGYRFEPTPNIGPRVRRIEFNLELGGVEPTGCEGWSRREVTNGYWRLTPSPEPPPREPAEPKRPRPRRG